MKFNQAEFEIFNLIQGIPYSLEYSIHRDHNSTISHQTALTVYFNHSEKSPARIQKRFSGSSFGVIVSELKEYLKGQKNLLESQPDVDL